jgi:hypothetical protein
LLKDLRSKPAPLVVCSAGDFYGTADVFNEPQSHFVAKEMGELGYDAIGVGEMDLNFGLATLVKDARDHTLPIICANLIAKGDSLRVRPGGPADTAADRLGSAFPPYCVVTRGKLRVGFLAVISPGTKAVLGAGPQSEREAPETIESLTYRITDPAQAVRAVAAELRTSCDVMVLLAHMGEEEASALVESVPGFDLVVLGHDPQGKPIGKPVEAGGARIVRASSQGQYVGEMELTLSGGRIEEARNRLHHLSAEYPDDPEMAAKLDRFDDENRLIQKKLYAQQQLAAADGGPLTNRYLGVGTCQSCHLEAFEVYRETAHAHAFQTLSAQFVHRDSNCVGCHVTGYGDVGGFSGLRSRGAMVDLVDVQCEACHGPGSEHTRDGSYRERARESCVGCHTENDDPDFDFDEDWPKIAH